MTAQVIIEGDHGFYLPAPLTIIQDDVETAWAGSDVEERIRTRDDISWLVANLCEAGPPNENGHVFGLDDLRARHGTVVDTALNMGHHRTHVVGTVTASALMAPEPTALAAAAGEPAANPYVKILAAFWKRRFPIEHTAVDLAFNAGQAHVSMEAIPTGLRCVTDGCCGKTFPYEGIKSDSYCDGLRQPRSPKHIVEPTFVGVGTIIPPMRPGWKFADVTQYAALISTHEVEAELVYNAIAETLPHLTPAQWDEMMAAFLADAFEVDAALEHLARAERAKNSRPVEARNPYTAMNGGMVCLYPDDAAGVAARTASDPNADPAAELHVTLAYVAEDAAAMADGARAAVLEGAALAARVRSEPLDLRVIGCGTFGMADPPATVLFLQADDAERDSGAAAAAAQVRAAMDHFGADAFPPAHESQVNHLTVGYGVAIEVAAQFVGETIRFSRGVTAVFGAEHIDIPWGPSHSPD